MENSHVYVEEYGSYIVCNLNFMRNVWR